MFFKILMKDLKRKKVMNIILFIFMIVASMLIASSVNMLYATTTALEHFEKESNLADNMVISISDKENDQNMEKWIKPNSSIEDSYVENTILVTAENIKIPSQYGELKDDATLVLSKVPRNYNLVFNQNNELFDLNQGEVAIPQIMAESYGIQIGDKIVFHRENVIKELTVKYFVKDVVFGSGMMSLKRMIISDLDYEDFSKMENNAVVKLWSMNRKDNVTSTALDKEFNKTSIVSVVIFNSDLISYSYIMDLILAGSMIIVSIFLIFISFLILRFTIVFTIEEDYKEIGIMKAIGLKNKGIKRIYMVKYFAIAFIGGCIGFIVSIPFAGYLLKSISNHIMMRTTFINYILSLFSVIFIIFITIGFCHLSSRKINKLSAIDAIRQGSTGERFSSSRKIKLHQRHYIKTPHYLAVSDLMSGFRRFIILMITFILGTALIIIPTNVINTLDSSKLITLFGRSQFDFYIGSSNYMEKYMKGSVDELLVGIDEIEQRIKEVGIDTEIFSDVSSMYKLYTNNKEESKTVLSQQALNYSAENFTYLKGTAPKLANEIAITTVTAEYFGVDIGDSIYCSLGDQTNRYVITGLYQSMNNLGYSLRFSKVHPVNLENAIGFPLYGTISGKEVNKDKAISTLKDNFPELDINSSQEYVESMIGNIVNQLGMFQNLILVLVLGINFLITSLLVRMLITREVPEIAVLKSIGFKNKDIRSWQATRIAIVLVISIIIGTIFANVTDNYITAGIFRGMGITQLTLYIRPLQVYVIYPVLILVVTMIAVLTSLFEINKIQIWEINNQE